MNYTVFQLAALFLVYAFLGWCVEVCFVAVTSGQVVNRGFLNGPVCPIYGVGMLGVLILLEPLADNLALLFALGMILCSLVELIGGWLLEKIFHTRWWDYSDNPFNLHGYICLGISILWGLAVVFVVKLVHPLICSLLGLLPDLLGTILVLVLYGLFLADFIVTLVTIVGMKKRLGEMEKVAKALHTVGDNISDRLGNSALAADARLDEFKETSQEKLAEGKEKLAESKEKLEAAQEARQLKRDEAKEARQLRLDESRERLELRVSETLQELYDRKAALELRKQELSAGFREKPKFGVRRLSKAFPSMREALKEHLDQMDEE